MKLLVDSDCLVGAFREGDPHSTAATELIDKHSRSGTKLHASNLVIQESATVLSHRVGMDAVRLFYQKYPKLGLYIVDIDPALEKLSWDIFLRQTKKGTSFVDCSNLAVIQKYKLEGILSFDSFYPKSLLVH